MDILGALPVLALFTALVWFVVNRIRRSPLRERIFWVAIAMAFVGIASVWAYALMTLPTSG